MKAVRRFTLSGVMPNGRHRWCVNEGPRQHLTKKCLVRLLRNRDPETGKHYVFRTNHSKLAAKTIAEIYKAFWQVELFFNWIKQNLKIKSFIGTSKNAVMTQIWVALCMLKVRRTAVMLHINRRIFLITCALMLAWDAMCTSIQFRPTYPKEAVENCTEGYVVVKFFLSDEGFPIEISIVESHPEGVFDESVLEVMKKWAQPEGHGTVQERRFNYKLAEPCEKVHRET